MFRVGIGFDVHRFSRAKKLILGGVWIPYELGLLGHSDADVLTHALCDAILGAVGEGDIGKHFPPDDPRYKGITSLILLERVVSLVNSRGFTVENVDSTIVAERPKISDYISQMKEKLSPILRIPKESIGIKATTTDGMGAIGKGEGIAAYAVVLVRGCS